MKLFKGGTEIEIEIPAMLVVLGILGAVSITKMVTNAVINKKS